MLEMTKEWLRAHCKKHGLYGTPSLNEKLFLHYQGFGCIQNLEDYIGLKTIFLEGNGLECLNGLERCRNLRCLFAQQNMIHRIPPTLPSSLSTLNISNNSVSKLENLSRLSLQTLQASHCKLRDLDSIRELTECKLLSCVDLQQNMIKGNPDEFLRIFGSMPKLACLYMQGNPIVSLMPQYRKRMISVIPTLTYLDDRPVFLLERLCAEAWANGGLSEEVKARRMYTDMEDAKLRRNHEFMSLLREEKRRPRSLDKQGYGADIDLVSQIDSVLQGRSEREPDNLIAARMKLIRYHAKSGKAQESDEEQLEKQLTNF